MSSARFSAGIARIRPGRAQLLFLFQPGDQRLRTDDLVAQTHLHVGIRRKEQIDPRAELDETALSVLLGPAPYPGIRNDSPRDQPCDLAEQNLLPAMSITVVVRSLSSDDLGCHATMNIPW